MFPASSPYVLSVGGTMGPEAGGLEVACQSDGWGTITSGGGFSRAFPLPVWQKESVTNYLSSLSAEVRPSLGFAGRGRGYPDVALAANAYVVI